MNQISASADVTNVLPVTALGTEYYQIVYIEPIGKSDAYAVIATKDSTEVYQDNIPVATLNRGDVYFKGGFSDMTGSYISSNKPIAHFALTIAFAIFGHGENLFQQMSPIHVWGKNFFSPVSHPIRDVVRIVVSQPNTNITQIGGTLRPTGNAQMTLDNLQPGQFVELEVPISSSGCYIKANEPVGVLTFYGGGDLYGDAAPAWLPPIEQSVTSALVAPFVPSGNTVIHSHDAVVVTPTATRNSTKISIDGASPTNLSGGSWIENDTAKMSFYIMPLTNTTAAYYFTNPEGFLVFCYGYGLGESYYYLAYSAIRDLNATFYANNVHCDTLENTTFYCKDVNFRAEIEGEYEELKWFIDGVEYKTAKDSLEWSKSFEKTGNYAIKMEVRFANGEEETISGTLKMKIAWIKMRNIRY